MSRAPVFSIGLFFLMLLATVAATLVLVAMLNPRFRAFAAKCLPIALVIGVVAAPIAFLVIAKMAFVGRKQMQMQMDAAHMDAAHMEAMDSYAAERTRAGEASGIESTWNSGSSETSETDSHSSWKPEDGSAGHNPYAEAAHGNAASSGTASSGVTSAEDWLDGPLAPLAHAAASTSTTHEPVQTLVGKLVAIDDGPDSHRSSSPLSFELELRSVDLPTDGNRYVLKKRGDRSLPVTLLSTGSYGADSELRHVVSFRELQELPAAESMVGALLMRVDIDRRFDQNAFIPAILTIAICCAVISRVSWIYDRK